MSLDGPDGIDEARWERLMDAPARRPRLVTHGVPIQHDHTQRTYPCGFVEKRENYGSGRHVHVSTRPDDAITCAECIAAGATKP